jgi:hypothetical protein
MLPARYVPGTAGTRGIYLQQVAVIYSDNGKTDVSQKKSIPVGEYSYRERAFGRFSSLFVSEKLNIPAMHD